MIDRETVERVLRDGLLEALPHGVLQLGVDGKIVGSNRAASRILGLAPEILEQSRLGDPPLRFHDADGVAIAFGELVEPHQGATTLLNGKRELAFATHGGDPLWLAMSFSPLEDWGRVVSFEDVTEVRQQRLCLDARSRVVDASASGSVRELLRFAIDEAESLTGSGGGFCVSFQGDEPSSTLRALSTRCANEEGDAGCRAIEESTLWASALRDGRPAIQNDDADPSGIAALPRGIARVLVAPVLRGGRVVALFVVANKPTPYQQSDVDAVLGVGEIASILADQMGARESLRFDEAALESSLSAVALAGVDGRLRYVNPAFLRLWGIENAGEAIGSNLVDYWKDQDGAGRLFSSLQQGDGAIDGELVALRRDGSSRQVHFAANFVRDATGQPIGMLGTFVDISERVRQEEALRESEARLRAIFDAEPECVKLMGKDGTLLDMNPAGLAMLEVDKPEEVIGRPLISMVAPEHRETFASIGRRVFAGESAIGEFEIVGRKGTRRWMETHAVPLRDERSAIICLLAVTRDITSRKRTQDALRESEEKLRGLYELSPLGIALTNMDGRYVEFNDEFRRICGYPTDELLQLDYWTLTPREYEKLEARQLESLAETGRYGPYEKEYVQKDGRRIPIRLNGMLVADREGRRHIWSIVEDMSEQRRFEEERRRVERQLQRSQKLESLGSLAGGVAHDINNVLAAIMSLANVEKDKSGAGSSLAESMETIIRACLRGGSLVKGLLGFARTEPEEAKPVDLNAIVRDESENLERSTSRNVTVQLDLDERLHAVRGDVTALSHALRNLCANSLAAMRDGGTLTLRTRSDDHASVLLQVIDDGSGMALEIQDKAFDPFFTTKPQDGRTGLGLAIVYGAVTAHGGTIELESAPGAGTTVSIRLPACGPAEAEPGNGVSLRGEARALRVLVVDDDEFVQKSSDRVLASFGHVPSIARCGEEAIEMLEKGLDVDVIILDINMPGIGGVVALSRIRESWPDVPVLLATGRPDQKAIDLARTTSRVELLAKPFPPATLNENLLALVEKWPRSG